MIALVVVVVLVILAALQARGTDVVGSLSRPFMPAPPPPTVG